MVGSRETRLAVLVAALVLVVSGLVPSASSVRAVGPDPSDVVLVMDFSASILQDKTTRNRFGGALERIADRVDETSADLVAGDATVSFVQFATRAADVPGCADMRLQNSPAAVSAFAGCLRSVAAAYRKGVTASLTRKIGVDTNYVAALNQGARHLPPTSLRPSLILFTDGKHDVKGVPSSRVKPTLDALFGSRTPFALLPVGMGLAAKDRKALTAGLEALRVTRAMPACVDGATFEWPQVVFQTAAQAGNAVAVALQNATCTFTVAPTPTPVPTPVPIPVRVSGIHLTPSDGKIDLTWARPIAGPGASARPVTDYMARCRPSDGTDWIESAEGSSTDPKASVVGLTNGTAYQCEIAAVVAATDPVTWTPAGAATPLGRPAPPAKPTVSALNRAVEVSVPAQSGASRFQVECSNDNGGTWPARIDTATGDTSALLGNLTNGTEYVCRAFAVNTIGPSDASPLSDAVRPCSGPLECNPILAPVVGALGAVLIGGILAALYALFRGRTRGHVIAVVDVIHSANVGHGSSLGIGFTRDGRIVTGIVADRGAEAEVRIRRTRSRKFVVQDRTGRREVDDGAPIVVTDKQGVRHSLVLQAFDTNAASEVATRR